MRDLLWIKIEILHLHVCVSYKFWWSVDESDNKIYMPTPQNFVHVHSQVQTGARLSPAPHAPNLAGPILESRSRTVPASAALSRCGQVGPCLYCNDIMRQGIGQQPLKLLE